jgi:dephospho-CoA kinase
MLRDVTKVIGLTGPIGAGKNEVAKILRRHGFFVIDADLVAHDLYSTQSQAWHELVKCCGSKILNRGGRINRKKLAEIVFSDKRKLAELDRIIHPYLKEAIIQIAEKQKAESRKPIVINAAVLKEIGLLDYVDKVWVVMASRGTRLKRLVRSGLSRAEAEKRMRAQASQAEYLKMADVVVQNEGALAQLKKRIGSLI